MKRPRLQAVQAHPDFTLKLTFVNGQVFDLDLNDDIKHYPGLKSLHDSKAFAGAAIGDDGSTGRNWIFRSGLTRCTWTPWGGKPPSHFGGD